MLDGYKVSKFQILNVYQVYLTAFPNKFKLSYIYANEQRGEKGDQGIAGMPGLPGSPVSITSKTSRLTFMVELG